MGLPIGLAGYNEEGRTLFRRLNVLQVPRTAMGEFHDAVSTLLEAFGRGIDIIKCQRGTREKEQLPIEPAKKSAETHLSKSLKKNRVDVKNAYGRDLARHGPGFAVGDGKTFLLRASHPIDMQICIFGTSTG